ncbi:SDR family oxidoreductase [Occultella glacieicola]|uniref:SDR family oxidoreductase n=1 Tax=Occultella glacieicola TaxID=2518684 RepID=A0ABY2E993_9MICO|nr:SDR family oxidoreductase [Occultella glacieicola]TDE98843.1 SDR family oxidoreductase [Occultella glacieicola]
MIAVTGVTGHLGRLIVQALLRRGVEPSQVIAAVRTPARADDLADRGVNVREADYDRPETLAPAFAGVDVLVLVSGNAVGERVRQHGAAIDAAKSAGVKHLLYTSVLHADTTPLLLAPEHRATEELIAAAGIPATLLRNGWYTENYVANLEQARESSEILGSVGAGRVAAASRADFAEAAAVAAINAAANPEQAGVYELSGDEAWDYATLADAVGQVIGRPVAYRDVTTAEHEAILTGAGLDEGTAAFVAGLDANIRDGLLAGTSGDLARLIGRPTTPLREGLSAALATSRV